MHGIQFQSWFWNHFSSINSRITFFKSSISLKATPIFSYLYPIMTLSTQMDHFELIKSFLCPTHQVKSYWKYRSRKSALILHLWGLWFPLLQGLSLMRSEQPSYFSSSSFYSQLQYFPHITEVLMSSNQIWSKHLIIENPSLLDRFGYYSNNFLLHSHFYN